jgi:pyruvate,orthophosphate dikinase
MDDTEGNGPPMSVLDRISESTSTTTGYVYDFADGNASMADLLGGKGANLAEMTRLGLPVPPGFTVTTDACRAYLTAKRLPAGLEEQIGAHLRVLEEATGRKLGDRDNPLLVSVRSGAKFSMPGMMETVLNVGVCDATVDALAKQYGDERFAWDCYRRLVMMYGKTVFGVPAEPFEVALSRAKVHAGHHPSSSDTLLGADVLRELAHLFQAIVFRHSGQRFPQDPREQLIGAMRAVFSSWNGERARIYRRREGIAESLGTAVTVMAMVFGNLEGNRIGSRSGTGVAFTRDPATGEPGAYGDYLADAEGEDVVSGARSPVTLEQFSHLDPVAHSELLCHMTTLEGHYRDLCDIEFTVERGKLWLLQTRVGKRTPAAAFRIAATLLDSGVITEDEALTRVTGQQLAQLMFPWFLPDPLRAAIATGVAASPGAAVGRAVFTCADAVSRAAAGEKVILIRRETNPDDLPGMIAAVGVLTGRGGKTSHAAVVARGMGRTCVCGVEALDIDEAHGRAVVARGGAAGVEIRAGDVISIDGTTGAVYDHAVPVTVSPVVTYFESGTVFGRYADPHNDPVIAAVARIMAIADKRRRLGVRANADTPTDAARARRFGACGIGLARTEHMFLGKRRPIVERLILADHPADRARALKELLKLQRADFTGLLEAMDGLPVTVRLLDPPLHEFLPDLTDLSVQVALNDAVGTSDAESERQAHLLAAVQHWHEQNPMLGLRGVRLGLVVPGIYAMQVRALAEAMVIRRKAGGNPIAHVMIPLVADAHELDLARKEVEQVLFELDPDLKHPVRIGTMIELPRAALTAGAIAEHAEFFSFGTNDLTQTTWGMSRDDAESAFFPEYLTKGVFAVSPFESIDPGGVGELIQIAVERGRATRPDLEIGVCGEHGGDPASIRFFHNAGIDYVSCSPFQVPVARLEAGRVVVLGNSAMGNGDTR